MELKDQVCSLELAKKLKELGVKQESLSVWYTNAETAHLLYIGDDGLRPFEEKTYSAFTVAELGEMLPPNQEYPECFNTGEEEGRWCINFTKHHQDNADTEADARAKMLIYLIENKLVEIIN